MEFDLNKPHFRFFYEISQIPHVSYHEKAISDYVVDFAKKHGLEYIQDQWNNVVVYKPGSKGCENLPPVMLQAHMDMVGAKEDWSNHDFLNDPLSLKVKDGVLYAEGTTLGADDGHGVSYMLAILSDDKLRNPPLECVFTVQEETGLEGAMKLEGSYFKSKRLIGLDANGETRTVISANGGCTVTLTLPVELKESAGSSYKISIGGLLGGHSGKDSFEERGNGIQILARILEDIYDADESMRLVSFAGGSRDNVIPDSACAIITSCASDGQLERLVDESVEKVAQRLQYSDSGIHGGIEAADTAGTAMDRCDTGHVLSTLTLLQTGLQHRDITRQGHALSSSNLGVVSTEPDKLVAVISLRSCVPPEIDFMYKKICSLAGLVGANVARSHAYPGYNYKKESPLRDAYADYTRETLGRELDLFAGNGGNELGVLMSKVDGLDVISMGPWVYDNHTPRERMDIASFDLVYNQLYGFLEKLTEER